MAVTWATGKSPGGGAFIAGEFSGNWSSVRGEVKDTEFAFYSVAVDLERKSEVAGLFKAGITRGNAAVYAIFGASAGWWTIRTIIDTSFTILPGATGEVFTFSRRRVLAGFKPGLGVTLFVTNQLRLALEATYTTYFKKARVHRVFNDQFILGADAQAQARARPEVLDVVLKLSWRLG